MCLVLERHRCGEQVDARGNNRSAYYCSKIIVVKYFKLGVRCPAKCLSYSVGLHTPVGELEPAGLALHDAGHREFGTRDGPDPDIAVLFDGQSAAGRSEAVDLYISIAADRKDRSTWRVGPNSQTVF